jgi:hypothetical protein
MCEPASYRHEVDAAMTHWLAQKCRKSWKPTLSMRAFLRTSLKDSRRL